VKSWHSCPPDDAEARDTIVDGTVKLAKQGRLLKLGDDIEGVYPSPDGSIVILDYAHAPGELRRTAGGSFATPIHPTHPKEVNNGRTTHERERL